MIITPLKVQEQDRLTPSTRDVLHIAQQQAILMNATSVLPEHIFIALIVQGDERVVQVLRSLGMDFKSIYERAAQIFPLSDERETETLDVPLSAESYECLTWALSYMTYTRATALFPDHLLLAVLRHERLQPLLALLVQPDRVQRARLFDELGPDYTKNVDQFIYSRIRDLSVVYFNRGVSKRILRRFERPTETFTDVVGLDVAKNDLREIIDLLRSTNQLPNIGIRYPHGVLLVGPADNNTQLLVQATAGEAIVPLITLSVPALVELLIDTAAGLLRLEDLALPVREYTLFKRSDVAERGRRYVQYVFQEAKSTGSCILYLDQLDAITQLSAREGRDQMLSQLLVEMDGLNRQSRTVVIASTDRPDGLDPALFRTNRFERRVIVADSFTSPSVARTFCLVCRRPVQGDWKHCVYCGASLARVCPNCGAARIEVEGARYCWTCGTELR